MSLASTFMHKLYPFLEWYWKKIEAMITTVLLSLVVISWFKEGEITFSSSAFQWLLSPTVSCILLSLFLLAPAVLTLFARRSYKRVKWRSSFDLCTATDKLTPEDVGFTVLSHGIKSEPNERPYYQGYLSRAYRSSRNTHQENDILTNDREVLERIKRRKPIKSILLVGRPTEGKTRAAYELLKALSDFTVVSIKPNNSIPSESFRLLKEKRIVIFIDDLNHYVDRPADLDRLYTETKKVAKQCVILATCGDGPELSQVVHPSSNLNRFYEHFAYELSFVPITNDEKQQIASESRLSITADRLLIAPTPGWVVMDHARITMEARLKGLTQETEDTLHTLKLLRVAGVGPPTHQRVENVLKAVFQYQNTRLPLALAELAKNAFIKLPAIQEPIQPEEAYLRDVVSYVDGKHPKDDLNTLGQMLIDARDAEGLHYLAITIADKLKNYSKAIQYLQQAIIFKMNFYQAWYSIGLVHYEGGNECMKLQQPMLASLAYKKSISAYEKALKINPNYYQAWNNIGIILYYGTFWFRSNFWFVV